MTAWVFRSSETVWVCVSHCDWLYWQTSQRIHLQNNFHPADSMWHAHENIAFANGNAVKLVASRKLPAIELNLLNWKNSMRILVHISFQILLLFTTILIQRTSSPSASKYNWLNWSISNGTHLRNACHVTVGAMSADNSTKSASFGTTLSTTFSIGLSSRSSSGIILSAMCLTTSPSLFT